MRRLLVATVAALATVASAAGLAGARPSATPIGTGVVVIETDLRYAGGAGAGSGMVLTPTGEVLTNNHVIRGATRIRIVVPRTGRAYPARVLGYDVVDDVAVLRAVGASNLKTVRTGASATARVGDRVVAIGNAGGGGALVSATGRITGLRKSIVVGDESGGTARLAGLIETDVAIQPGDSGGPLLRAGKVVGMNTAGSRRTVDAYAIPIDRALAIVRQIEAGKSSQRVHVGPTPFLGIEFDAADGGGVVIADVVSGGPAASAGLRPGDVINAIDGYLISSPESIPPILLAKKPGARVKIDYTDASGGSRSTTVRLGTGPAQ